MKRKLVSITQSKHCVQEIDWERELREAGWKPHTYRGHERRNMWISPQGTMHLGPYGAWRLMQSMKQWPTPDEGDK